MATNEPIKPDWKMDYNFRTDKCDIPTPYCPSCGEYLYDHEQCVFCKQAIEWCKPSDMLPNIEVEHGDYKAVQVAYYNTVYLSFRGQLIERTQCAKRFTEDELLKIFILNRLKQKNKESQ